MPRAAEPCLPPPAYLLLAPLYFPLCELLAEYSRCTLWFIPEAAFAFQNGYGQCWLCPEGTYNARSRLPWVLIRMQLHMYPCSCAVAHLKQCTPATDPVLIPLPPCTLHCSVSPYHPWLRTT